MRRVTILLLLLTFGVFSIAVSALRQPGEQAAREVQVAKLRDNLYMLQGGGGNTGVFVTASGVVVVDTKNPGWGRPILDKIRELTNLPVTTIINTHTHGDHVSGNVEFPATVYVIAHENTKANMERMGPVTGFPPPEPGPTIFEANNGRGLPTTTFKERMSVGSGRDRIDLYYFGRGHTDGDAWVVFPELRVLQAGDIFLGKNIPLLDANNGGSGVALPDTLTKAAETLTNIDTIITGHSTTATPADLREFAQFNREFREMVREGMKAGRSVEEMASGWVMPAKYVGYGTPQPARLRSNIQVILDELR